MILFLREGVIARWHLCDPFKGAGEALQLPVWHAVQVTNDGEELDIRRSELEGLPLLAPVHGIQLQLVGADETEIEDEFPTADQPLVVIMPAHDAKQGRRCMRM